MVRPVLFVVVALITLTLFVLPTTRQPITAAPAPAQTISVAIIAPAPERIFDDTQSSITINVRVTATYEVADVTATVEAITTMLSFSAATNGDSYSGSIDLAQLDRGRQTLVVTATDVLGNSGQAEATFTIRGSLVQFIESPLDQTVVDANQVAVRINCAGNPTGCNGVGLSDCSGATLVEGSTSISYTLMLPSDQPLSSATICLYVTDSLGRSTFNPQIYYNVPPALQRLVDAPSKIIDADASRLLIYRRTTPAFTIIDRATGQETPVGGEPLPDPWPLPAIGRLTPDGALYISNERLYQWSPGTTSDLGPLDISRPDGLIVQGTYAVWIDERTQILYRRDLAAGTTLTVSEAVEPGSTGQVALYPNGDIVYVTAANRLMRYSDGDRIVLIETPNTTLSHIAVDWANVFYLRCNTLAGGCDVVQLTDGKEQVLVPGISAGLSGSEGSYGVNNGWLAYTKPGNGAANQLWLRAPDGSEERISFLNTTHTVDAVGSDGTVIWNNNAFISRPGQPPLIIGNSDAPTQIFADRGNWELVVGRTLFSIGEPIVYDHTVHIPMLTR